MHIDLQRVVENQKIHMEVPIHYLNETACVGVKIGGGTVQKTRTEVEVICFPRDLPEYLEVDLQNLEVDELLHLSDIKLPDGVELTDLIADPPRDEPIVSVHVLRGSVEDEQTAAPEAPAEVPTVSKPEKDKDE